MVQSSASGTHSYMHTVFAVPAVISVESLNVAGRVCQKLIPVLSLSGGIEYLGGCTVSGYTDQDDIVAVLSCI